MFIAKHVPQLGHKLLPQQPQHLMLPCLLENGIPVSTASFATTAYSTWTTQDPVSPSNYAKLKLHFCTLCISSRQALLHENLLHGGAHLRGRLAHRDARALQRLDLVGGGALAARDDGAGVAHAPPRRRRQPCRRGTRGGKLPCEDYICNRITALNAMQQFSVSYQYGHTKVMLLNLDGRFLTEVVIAHQARAQTPPFWI